MHIVTDVSAHGFGHLAQTCRLLEALRTYVPDLRVTFRTMLPAHRIEEQYPHPFENIEIAVDVGMIMEGAVTVLPTESLAAYRRFHADWQDKIVTESRRLQGLNADLLISNAAYLGLAGAALAKIPAFGFCSLNWAEIFGGYCYPSKESGEITRQINEAYNAANLFIQPVPHMPMSSLRNGRSVGVAARKGVDRSVQLRERLGVEPDVKLGLISMGGIPTELPVHRWPRQSRVHWITRKPDEIKTFDLSFIDLIASVDVILTKPGYGMIAEAAVNGIPILYLPRGDWPEERYLLEWFARNGRGLAITPEEFETGALSNALPRLLEIPKPPPPTASGADEAARLILQTIHLPARSAGEHRARLT